MAAPCGLVPPRVLSFKCHGGCEAPEPCLMYPRGSQCVDASSLGRCMAAPITDAGPIAQDRCEWSCFRWQSRPTDTFSMYITHGKYKSEEELEYEVNDPDWEAKKHALEQYHQYYSYASNDDLQVIDRLRLPPFTTKVLLVGGTDLNGLKGRVVSVFLNRGLLQDQRQVVNVAITNMNLRHSFASITSLLPSSISVLDISNNLLENLPSDLPHLRSLTVLFAKDNYFTTIPPELTMDSLIKLNLRGNELTSFEAKFPRLQELSLAMNRLDRIPPVVYSFSELQSLNLTGNPIESIDVSEEEFDFLAGLDTLIVDDNAMTSLCANGELRTAHQLPMCVLSHSTSSSENYDLSQPAARTVETGPDAQQRLQVAMVLSLFVLIGVGFVGMLWYRRRRLSKRRDLTRSSSRGSKLDMNSKSPSMEMDHYNLASTTASTDDLGSCSSSDWHSRTYSTPLDDLYSLETLENEFSSYRLNADFIQNVRMLGTGGYGDVWLVQYNSGDFFAAKRLKRENASRTRLHSFICEIRINSGLRHGRIVTFIGVSWTTNRDVQAVFEYMPMGDLRTCLEAHHLDPGWCSTKLQIAMDIIDALLYVHSFAPPLVHRDLKSRNVLLDEDMRAKLCDFGVSRFRSDNGTMTMGVGTARWVAPEVINGEYVYGEKADIYSFGVVLSELDSHKLPYEDERNGSGERLAEVAVIHRVGLGSLTPSFSSECPHEIAQLATRCLAFDPSQRPCAVEIAFHLSRIEQRQLAHDEL